MTHPSIALDMSCFSPEPLPPQDKYLKDPLEVSDIDGAIRKLRYQRSSSCSKLLEVDDIAGTRASWRPFHKQHFGVHLR